MMADLMSLSFLRAGQTKRDLKGNIKAALNTHSRLSAGNYSGMISGGLIKIVIVCSRP